MVFGLLGTIEKQSTKMDIFKVETPLKPPILFLFDPELCETVYRAAGAQPIRPSFDALM